jgi:hypothetical protein
MAEEAEIEASESMEVPVEDFITLMKDEEAQNEEDEEEPKNGEDEVDAKAEEPEPAQAPPIFKSTSPLADLSPISRIVLGCIFVAGAIIVGTILGTQLS